MTLICHENIENIYLRYLDLISEVPSRRAGAYPTPLAYVVRLPVSRARTSSHMRRDLYGTVPVSRARTGSYLKHDVHGTVSCKLLRRARTGSYLRRDLLGTVACELVRRVATG